MSKESTNYTLSELPEVLTAKYISDYLHVTNRQAYRWMATAPEAGGLKSFTIGRIVRTYKTDFIQWLEHHAK